MKIKMTAEEKIIRVIDVILEESKLAPDINNIFIEKNKFFELDVKGRDFENIIEKLHSQGIIIDFDYDSCVTPAIKKQKKNEFEREKSEVALAYLKAPFGEEDEELKESYDYYHLGKAEYYLNESIAGKGLMYISPDYLKLNQYRNRLLGIKPLISNLVLEGIARLVGDYKSGTEFVRIFEDVGVDERLIVYPNTKWIMLYDIFKQLVGSGIEKDISCFSELIKIFTSPLMIMDENKLNNIRHSIDVYLQIDGYKLSEAGIEKIVSDPEIKTSNLDNDSLKQVYKDLYISTNFKMIYINQKQLKLDDLAKNAYKILYTFYRQKSFNNYSDFGKFLYGNAKEIESKTSRVSGFDKYASSCLSKFRTFLRRNNLPYTVPEKGNGKVELIDIELAE